MFIPLSEQVFVPIHRIRRISFFGDYAIVRFEDLEDRKIDGEDAVRLKKFLEQTPGIHVGCAPSE